MDKKRDTSLSIIIPVGPDETEWVHLLNDLKVDELPNIEIILSATQPQSIQISERNQNRLRWVVAPKRGRAAQMNFGASHAQGTFLWFIHADNRIISQRTLYSVLEVISKRPRALLFFELKFQKPKPYLMRVNEWGVRFRSNWMKIPFGDQAFLIDRNLFWELGAYREDVAYGEDHLFVWVARHAAVPVLSIGLPISTSARKYEERGWSRTTLNHMWLTLKQALPEMLIGRRKAELQGRQQE